MDVNVSLGLVLTFSLYFLSIISFLSPRTNKNGITISILSVCLVLALFVGLVSVLGLMIAIATLGFAILTSLNRSKIKALMLGVLSFLALALTLHIVPGFNNQLIFESAGLGQSSLPFKLYANLDKAIAGIALLIAMRAEIKWLIAKNEAFFGTLCVLVFLGLAYAMGVGFDPKFGQLSIAFALLNLFVTCVAEEAFFRLIIQNGLNKLAYFRQNQLIIVLLTALIFALAHFHTGEGAEQRMLLIFLAGLIYAGVYSKTKSLGLSIYSHFSINILHFSFFTYPATF